MSHGTSNTIGPLEAKRSYKAGCVNVRINLRSHHDSTKIEATATLTTEQARALASSLIGLADMEDAKVKAKSAAEARRKAWRDREIAAGRLKVMYWDEVLRRD